jgi:hypothetical protein
MIKHSITRYLDGKNNSIDVKVSLYDDGLEIAGLDQAKPLHLYWQLNKLERHHAKTTESFTLLTYPENPNSQLLIDDVHFIEALLNASPTLNLQQSKTQTNWRTFMISLLLIICLGSMTAGIYWKMTESKTSVSAPQSLE